MFLSEDARKAILQAAVDSHPMETGGILVGVRTRKRPWVVTAIEIATNVRSHSSFLIPQGSTSPEIDIARRADSRLGYVGDWHVHPANLGVSGTDFATLKRVGAEVDGEVVTLVARRIEGSGYELEAWLCNGRRIREAQVVLTGPL